MKKTKLFLFALLALVIVVSSCSAGGESAPSHTHNFEGEWKSDETAHWKECKCGEKSEIKSHTTEGTWTVVTQPTEEKEGQEKTNCKVCGRELTKIIPTLIHTWNAGAITTEPTCTDAGVKTYTCTECGITKTESVEALGHSWNRISGTATTRADGTITYKCTVCNETKTENGKRVVPSTAISLDTLGSKSIIAESDLESYGVSSTSVPAKIEGATYYKFGVYPQTIKAAEVTIDETIINLEFDEVDYYLGSDNNWYAKCIENAGNTDCTYSDGTEVAQLSANSTKYFKVEPIVWRKLEGSGYLLSEKILTANVAYFSGYQRTIDSKTVYQNNYMHSRIRAFLNGYKYFLGSKGDNEDFYNKGFLQTAFTQSQRNQIQTTDVDNSPDSTTDSKNNVTRATTAYTCSNTQDKIFLLSMYEATIESNGFAEYQNEEEGNTRLRKDTDYAKANYLATKNVLGYSWSLRSPHYFNTGLFCLVRNTGSINNATGHVDDSFYGVVPALTIME